MEMEEITVEGGRKEEDVGASNPSLVVKTEGRAEPNPYSQLIPEAKTKEEAETEAYSKLQSPPEDIYSEAIYNGPALKKEAGKLTEGNARLYRAACFFLTMLCLILLLVIIILGVKLQTGSAACPERQEALRAGVQKMRPPTCSLEECQAHFPNTTLQHRSCQQCADGWLTFGRSCFLLSTFRLSWDESQKNCSSRGGSLAVISSLRVQQFLTHEGKVNYWIGLRQNSDKWAWVNNTALRQSYWAEGKPAGDCGILSSTNPPEKNWMAASCRAYTYFICQLQM